MGVKGTGTLTPVPLTAGQ